MWLTWRSRRRLLNLPRSMRERPYVAYCVGYMFVFVFAFSAFSNFGILARQRAQVMPAFLVLLCIPERRRFVHHPLDPTALDTPIPPAYRQDRRDDPYAALREQPTDNPYADRGDE
jgi:hypothetical protein